MEFQHKSVLLYETIDSLHVKPDGIYVDGTLGGGGHAYELCKRLNRNGRLIGIDQDEAAILAASERLNEFGSQATIVRSNYSQMPQVLEGLGIRKVDGIYLDLSVLIVKDLADLHRPSRLIPKPRQMDNDIHR